MDLTLERIYQVTMLISNVDVAEAINNLCVPISNTFYFLDHHPQLRNTRFWYHFYVCICNFLTPEQKQHRVVVCNDLYQPTLTPLFTPGIKMRSVSG